MEIQKEYNYSNGSTNPYKVEKRHNLIRNCLECHQFSDIILDGNDYYQYFVQGNGYIQSVFNYLDATQREHILTGLHPECQEILYGKEN